MKYFSTFSGIGGFELGIQQAYENIRDINVQKKRGREEIETRKLQEVGEGLHTVSSEATLPFENRSNEYSDWSIDERQPTCVGFSEIDKYATQIYQRHFPEHRNYGDITKINEKELPDFELLCGGFPCQSFSIAGKRGGFEDTRGTLFFEIARIIKHKQPRLLLLENVKGLLSHDTGKTFRIIIATLDELGYDVEWQVLNSKNFGVPQNRERVFIVGHLRGTPRPKVFPIGNYQQQTNELSGQHSNTLTTRYYGGQANGTYVIESKLDAQEIKQLNNPTHSNDRVYDSSGLCPTLNTMQGGNRQPFIPEGTKIRRLTPTECERLQGFPDDWTQGVSDSQRYKCLGNAVTVNVIEFIATLLGYKKE